MRSPGFMKSQPLLAKSYENGTSEIYFNLLHLDKWAIFKVFEAFISSFWWHFKTENIFSVLYFAIVCYSYLAKYFFSNLY